MPIRFVTGNANKLAEAQTVIPDLEQLDIDLPEIQELDSRAVITAKLEAALAHHESNVVVEDTSLHLDCLGGMPGPLIKWFMQAIGIDGIARIASALGNDAAEARVTIGYADASGAVQFFEGSLRGKIVTPRGETGFGWDPIFQPEGHSQTFAEMGQEQKDQISMRKVAFSKLRDFVG